MLGGVEDDGETGRARRSALRAARAVTLGAALALSGCGDSSHERADDGTCPDGGAASDDPDCCEEVGGIWDPEHGCAIPGPFVPPDLPA